MITTTIMISISVKPLLGRRRGRGREVAFTA
jgi:hypothetical protein